ncbi:MAG TPA: DUF6798 domain-containing protein [Thermoleophilaceae bacterium]|nr:DUF6798 domain-containing protein [Thermoleophilaceae bacterium]
MSAGPRPGDAPGKTEPADERSPRTHPPRSEIGARTEIRPPTRPPAARLAPVLTVAGLALLGIAFELVYGQAPLYTGNQHTYVLHGLAQAGVGLLPLDWQANTVDPTPATSVLVAAAAGLGSEWLLILLHVGLIGAYGVALVAIGVRLLRLDGLPRRLVFVALLLFVHSWVAARLGLPDDIRSLASKGLAGQYAPGLTFQPSLFGVLIVASLLVYARGRLLAAVALASAAAIFHPTYLLSAVVLCGAYLADVYARSRDFRTVAQAAALATVLLVPVAVYALVAFAPAPGGAHEAAQNVLVDYRIPHHAKPSKWFAPDDALRLAIVAGGLLVAWRTVLFPVLALSVAAAAALTAVQLATGSETLALLFPWRVSVWLVPVSAALLLAAATRAVFALGGALGRLAAWSSPARAARLESSGRAAIGVLAGLLIAVSLVAGLPQIGRLSAEPRRGPAAALVAGEARPGAIFLIPPRLHEFRVDAQVPVYVDYKSNPYEDLEVLAWRDRLRAATRVYRRGRIECRRAAALAPRARITHVVTEGRMRGERCPDLTRVRRTGALTLFRVAGAG